MVIIAGVKTIYFGRWKSGAQWPFWNAPGHEICNSCIFFLFCECKMDLLPFLNPWLCENDEPGEYSL